MAWQFPQTFPVLHTNQVHIWRATLKRSKEDLAEFTKLLNLQEKIRANKFIAKQAKNNFVVARGILRWLLGKYLGIKPQDILLQQNRYGKLYVASSALQFNLSHSHDLALFAFTQHHFIGVDVEFIRADFDFTAIAERFFSKTENLDLLALPIEQQLPAFFNCWSRKEAFIKALGKGLFCALDSFSVEVSNKNAGRLTLHFSDMELDTKNWALEALNPAASFVGAVATSCCKYQTSFYEF